MIDKNCILNMVKGKKITEILTQKIVTHEKENPTFLTYGKTINYSDNGGEMDILLEGHLILHVSNVILSVVDTTEDD